VLHKLWWNGNVAVMAPPPPGTPDVRLLPLEGSPRAPFREDGVVVNLSRLASRVEKLKSQESGRSSEETGERGHDEWFLAAGQSPGAEDSHRNRITERPGVASVQDPGMVAESDSSFVVLSLHNSGDHGRNESCIDEAPKVSNSDRHGLDVTRVPVSGAEGSHNMKGRSCKEMELGALDMDLEMGLATGRGKRVEEDDAADLADGEQICRVCHLGLLTGNSEAMELGCACKQDLAMCHRSCAEEWFRIRGNRLCEICGRTVENLPVLENETASASMTQTEGAAADTGIAAMRTSTARFRFCWQQQLVRNSLLACFVVIFMVPWFFRIAYFTK
jgi:hypothetical protein